MSNRVDARSAYPKWKSDGKSLKSLVVKYDDIVSGKVTAVKVESKALKQFRAVGYEISKGRVLVPHSEEETARRVAGGRIVIKNKSGIHRIQIPVQYHDLEEYLSAIEKNHKLVNSMKANNEHWGFRIREKGYKGPGGYSMTIYRDIRRAIEDLHKYEIVEKPNEFFAGLEIFTISKPSEWYKRVEEQTQYRRSGKGSKRNVRTAKKWRKKNRRNPRVRAKHAEDERKRRAKLKGKKKEEYMKKARKRAMKSFKKKGF